MKLIKLKLRNFRCYQEDFEISLDDFTVIVGKNDAGKSTILDALGLFFDEYKIDADDASIHGDKTDVRVICEFSDLPRSIIIDSNNTTTLKEEFLLNKSGNLEIHRVFNGSLKTPKPINTFAYADHPSVEKYNDLLYLKNQDLKNRAADLGIELNEIDKRANAQIRKKIWASISDHKVKGTEIDLDKEDAKKIWIVLTKQIPIYALFHSDRKSTDQDDEAQDPLKSAVAEAIKTKEQELEKITNYVQSEVLKIADETVNKIKQMDIELAKGLNPRFSKPNWAKVFGISLTDEEEISINKRGSGIRRLVLLNFFRAKAEKRLEQEEAPGIIYAIEEPETSQHPINQKILLNALRELSEQPSCQVIITTHTPCLVKDISIQNLRYIEKKDRKRILHCFDNKTYKLISKDLGIIPDHNVKLFIGVEGINDISFLKNISNKLIEEEEEFLDLIKLEQDGEIVFIPLGGSNLTLWTHRLAGLNRPEIHIFDCDDQPPNESHNKNAVDIINTRDNAKAFLTTKKEIENYIHKDAINNTLDISVDFTDWDDVPAIVAKELHIKNGGIGNWEDIDEDKKQKKISIAKKRLNNEVVNNMNASLLNEIDKNNDIRKWLNEIKMMYK